MPRKVVQQEKRPGNELFRALYEQTGAIPMWTLEDWDPKVDLFWQALTRVAINGGQLMIRAGSGGQALGISIWSNDERPPATYFNDEEQLQKWCERVLDKIPTKKLVIGEEKPR